MVAVPFGRQSYERAAAFQPETRLVNLYMEQDDSGASSDGLMRLQRPGMVRDITFTDPVRCIFRSDNPIWSLPIVVAGANVYEVDGSTTTLVGTVEDDGTPVAMAASFEKIIIVSAGNVYYFDGSTSVTQIATPNGELIADVDVLNAYFILPEANGTYYFLAPGSNTIDALNFATAEFLPDGLQAIRRVKDELFFFGRSSLEVWQTTGNADAPFASAPGRMLDHGCMARDTVQLFDNSVIWVGDDGIVYTYSGSADRISTFGIEERIRKRTGDPSAWAFTSFGHKFYVLNVPGQGTFFYDPAVKGWGEFSSSQSDDGWLAVMGCDAVASVVCADGTGGLYHLDPYSSADDQVPFSRLVTGTIAIPAIPAANQSMAVAVGSEAAVEFQLRWNDPRRGWSSPVTMKSRGGSDILNVWRLGRAEAPYRQFELSCVADAAVRIGGAVANEGWRV